MVYPRGKGSNAGWCISRARGKAITQAGHSAAQLRLAYRPDLSAELSVELSLRYTSTNLRETPEINEILINSTIIFYFSLLKQNLSFLKKFLVYFVTRFHLTLHFRLIMVGISNLSDCSCKVCPWSRGKYYVIGS